MNLEATYEVLILQTISVSFIFSICFIFIKVPQKESLRNYRISRKIMALAFLLIGISNIVEFVSNTNQPDFYFSSLVTVFLAAFQATFFTFTLLALINLRLVSIWKLIRELIPVVILTIAAFISYYSHFERLFKPVFYIFSFYYLTMIIRYSVSFFRSYRLYVRKLDNYFSIQTANKLRWVKTVYFAMLLIGCISIIPIYTNELFAVLFNVLYILFFIYFGIRFINYVYIFQEIETAITHIEKKELKVEKNLSSFNQLDHAISEWEFKKGFTEPNINIEQVAAQVKTNRTYLSNYINTNKMMTFNDWINQLRIEEAKNLMLDNPNLPVSQIGVMVGLPDKSNFGRQFSKMTGISPLAWRSKQFDK